jgi:hypothetical protein
MAQNGSAYGPSINACRLWEKVSAKGTRYLTGRLGGLRVTILPNTRPAEGDDSTHSLMIGEASAAKKPAPTNGRQAPPPPGRFGDNAPDRKQIRLIEDDQVPF